VRLRGMGIARAWRRLGLAKKIVVMAFAGSAVVVASFAYLAFWSLDQSTGRILQERLVLATAAAESVDQFNTIVLQQLDLLGQGVVAFVKQGDVDSVESVLETGRGLAISFLKNVMVVDASGQVIGAFPSGAFRTGSLAKDLPGVEPVLVTGKPFVSGIIPSSVDGRPAVLYEVPLKQENGQVVGVLLGEMDVQKSGIAGFIGAIKLGRSGYAQVVDGKGELIASTQPEEVFGKSDHGDRFVALIEDKKSVVRTCHSCHDPDPAGSASARRKDVLAFAPLSTASWGVAVRQSEEEALAQTRGLREAMLIVGAIALAVAFPGSIAIAGRAVRPVLLLTDSSKRMASGDLSTPIPEMGEDEVGTLAENLEFMRSSLKHSHEEVERRRMEAESLYDINLEISSLLDTDKILGSVVHEARTLLVADIAILTLRNEQGGLYVRAISGAQAQAASAIPLTPGRGFAGAVFARGHPLSTGDYLNDPTFVRDTVVDAALSREGLRSHLGVPLKVANQVLGALVVARREAESFTRQEVSLLARLGNQASIAIHNANLYEEVSRKESLRGQLLQKVISAQEDERKRIARELHDEPAQIFSALVMQLEGMGKELPDSEALVKDKLRKLQGLAAHALETVRKLMSDLRPTYLDDLGLIPAIRQYAADRLGNVGVNVNVLTSNMDRRLPGQVETAIFRVFQEAINNIYKHAGACNASIRLTRDSGKVLASISDDGKGFDVDSSEGVNKNSGLGLVGIEERVSLLGGTLNIKSKPGKGTELRIEVPVPDGGADEQE